MRYPGSVKLRQLIEALREVLSPEDEKRLARMKRFWVKLTPSDNQFPKR